MLTKRTIEAGRRIEDDLRLFFLEFQRWLASVKRVLVKGGEECVIGPGTETPESIERWVRSWLVQRFVANLPSGTIRLTGLKGDQIEAHISLLVETMRWLDEQGCGERGPRTAAQLAQAQLFEHDRGCYFRILGEDIYLFGLAHAALFDEARDLYLKGADMAKIRNVVMRPDSSVWDDEATGQRRLRGDEVVKLPVYEAIGQLSKASGIEWGLLREDDGQGVRVPLSAYEVRPDGVKN